MKKLTHYCKLLPFLALIFFGVSACKKAAPKTEVPQQEQQQQQAAVVEKTWLYAAVAPEDIKVKMYVRFMDSLAKAYDSLVPYDLTHHIIARHNTWLIDSLENTDFYYRNERGQFVYDQKELLVVKKGDTLYMPTDTVAKALIAKQAQTRIDINIPEFKLRIIEGTDTPYTLPIRVGQNKAAYWTVNDAVMNMKTRIGKGKIVDVYFKKGSIDPQTGKDMIDTKRDDGKKTLMPLSPWIEPEVNGERFGQLIHPTTNLATLGKAYSNGCIGTREGDIWLVYYYAPVGTPVTLRYDLMVKDSLGNPLQLKDVYKKPKGK